MDELTLVERFRAEVPTVTDLPDAHRTFSDGMSATGTRARRPVLRIAVAAGAASVLAAGAVAVASQHGSQRQPAKTTQVMAFARQAADVARHDPDPVPLPGQWIYQKVAVDGDGMKGGGGGSTFEEWWLADRGRHPEKAKFGIRTDYPYLRSLPTEPRALLDRIRHDNPRDGATARGEFIALYLIVRDAGVMPPQLRPALYQAFALIPGVALERDAVDGAGRHGVALVMDTPTDHTELVFNPRTYRYMGERSTDTQKGRTYTYGSAFLVTAVVDHKGERPS